MEQLLTIGRDGRIEHLNLTQTSTHLHVEVALAYPFGAAQLQGLRDQMFRALEREGATLTGSELRRAMLTPAVCMPRPSPITQIARVLRAARAQLQGLRDQIGEIVLAGRVAFLYPAY